MAWTSLRLTVFIGVKVFVTRQAQLPVWLAPRALCLSATQMQVFLLLSSSSRPRRYALRCPLWSRVLLKGGALGCRSPLRALRRSTKTSTRVKNLSNLTESDLHFVLGICRPDHTHEPSLGALSCRTDRTCPCSQRSVSHFHLSGSYLLLRASSWSSAGCRRCVCRAKQIPKV